MKWILIILLILFCIAFTWLSLFGGEQLSPTTVNAQRLIQQTQKSATQTPSPLPTVDYAASLQASDMTRVSAVETANEAGRINAAATADHEQILVMQGQQTLDAAQLTAEKENVEFVKTAIAATVLPTIIPLTSTQQVIVNTKVSAERTATKEYPTQIVSVALSENAAKCGMPCYLFSFFPGCAIGVFCVGLVIYLFVRIKMDMRTQETQGIKPPPTITDSMYRVGKELGHYKLKNEVPCSPEQFTELAELVVNGERNFAINRLENNSRTLRRSMLYQMREFYLSNNLANEGTPGQIVLNEEGREFHVYWFDNHELPDEYRFVENSNAREVEES